MSLSLVLEAVAAAAWAFAPLVRSGEEESRDVDADFCSARPCSSGCASLIAASWKALEFVGSFSHLALVFLLLGLAAFPPQVLLYAYDVAFLIARRIVVFFVGRRRTLLDMLFDCGAICRLVGR
ncbi:hypothetical protein BC567DRAFT_215091 [Phyllosticta citribraziliensis]